LLQWCPSLLFFGPPVPWAASPSTIEFIGLGPIASLCWAPVLRSVLNHYDYTPNPSPLKSTMYLTDIPFRTLHFPAQTGTPNSVHLRKQHTTHGEIRPFLINKYSDWFQ
jgi:hypothetical protein